MAFGQIMLGILIIIEMTVGEILMFDPIFGKLAINICSSL